MTTNIAKEKLKSLVDCAVEVAQLYATGYTTLRRCNEITVTFTPEQDTCDGTTTVNAGLLANAFIYTLMRQCCKEKGMIGHTGCIYPGKGISKTYFLLARRKGSAALTQDVDELNTMAAVYTDYPPVSLFYAMHKKCIPHYLDACRKTSTAVFDKETGAYVFRSRNKVINLIADMFNAAFTAKRGERIRYSEQVLDDIITEVEDSSKNQEKPITPTETREKPAVAEEKPVATKEKPAETKEKPVKKVKKAKTKQAPVAAEEVVAAVEEAIASPEKQPETEEKTYGLTEEEFISVFLSLEEEGKERWAKKLRPVLEGKKQPFIEQLKQIAQMQLDLEAQAKLVAEKVAAIDKVINKMASFFNA